MVENSPGFVFAIALVGVAIGLVMLVRGFVGYRMAAHIGDTATSRIATLAAGEVRVTGVIDLAGLELVSLLQSMPCVYFRSTIESEDDTSSFGLGAGDGILEERSVGFEVRDDTGAIRVFPRGARIEAPVRLGDDGTLTGEEPPGLRWRVGGAFDVVETNRDDAVAALLTVRDPGPGPTPLDGIGAGRRGRRTYRETRLEPGDQVTIVGRAVPFSDIDDPAGADVGGGMDPATSGGDPEVAADVEAARAAGTLLTDPEAAWGNAAIPGFGIGRPVRPAAIDPAADPLPLGTPEAAAQAERTFSISPEALVLAAAEDAPLLITYGSPEAAAGRERGRFVVGLLGALLAIASAVVAASVFGRSAT